MPLRMDSGKRLECAAWINGGAFMAVVLSLPEVAALLSDGHFSVDGILIEAWASMKSFRRKDGCGKPSGPGRNGEHTSAKRKG